MNKFLIILFCCFAAVRSSFAATESFRVRKETSQLVVSSSVPLMTLYDDKYMTMATNANWSSLFTNYKVKNYLRVGINPDVPQTNNQTGSVSFKLKLWKWNAATNAFVTSTETRTLSLNYINSDPNAIVDEIATYAFADAHRVEVYLTAVSGTPFEVNDIYVSAEVEVERYYTFDGGAVSGLSVTAVASDPNQPLNLNYLRFDWNHKTGAEFYELEWVHISDATLQTNVFKSTSDLTYNYYLNSTRVLVRGNSYRIPKIFDHGYVLYRVRAIGLTGSSFSIRKDGTWSNAAESGTVASHNSANRLFISGDYDPGMNWAHQVAYGDNGERFESVSFADGLGRGRQSVGHNTETQQAVVSNVYYDELGRPVISDLPTPQDYEVLQHKPGFNETAVDDATAYQQQFFDTDASDACNPVSEGMSTTSGAGKYYSPSNPDQDGENARIPDAEKFPFSRVTYRNDFTGRVDKVSSAGDDLKTGGGHETQFAYPSANQDELNKLFGAEVGQASHYQKMVTIDANGQVYVQYSDLAGRVIASYLEGDSPQNVDAIEGNATNTVTTHLLPQNAQNINSVVPSATLTYNEYISQNAGYIFNYAFTPKQFHDACMGQTVCLDCVYDLTIKIVDDCNNVVYSKTQSLIGADLDKLCATKPEVTITTPAVSLTKGEYQIVKTLSVNQQAIKDNWCYYVDNATCIEPLSNLFNEQYTTEPFADCNPGVTETQEDECAVRKALMLKDLSPGGQYAGYVNTGGTLTPLTAGAAVHSVLTLNSLGTNKDWKHPVPYYKNADGTAALVNGVAPQNLSFQDFVTYFQPSWAEALLSYHPENCFLQFCESAGYDASKDYDAAMLATPSFSGACPAGYYKPLSSTQVTTPVACTTFVSGDPFFVPGGVGNSKYNDMNAAMNNYQGSGYTIWQYAVYEAFCNGTGSISTCLDNYNSLGTTEKNCYNDLIWVTYRSMYLELKANFVYQIQHSQAGCSNAQIGVDANWLNNHAIWGNLATMPDADGDGFPENGSGLTQAEFETYMDNQAATQCQTVCEEYANEWLGVLSGCEQIAALSGAQLAALKTDLINLCKSGCNSDHPMGSSTSPAGQTIDDVLLTHLGAGYEDAFCTGLLISEPAPYQTTTELENAVIKPLDVCACDAVLQANWDLTNNNPENYTLEQLLAANTGVSLEDANYLVCQCDKFVAGTFNPEIDNWVENANQQMAATGITIPATLACNSGNGCVDCATVNTHYNALIQRFSGVADFTTTATYPVILTNYLNNKLHFTLGYNDYTEFIGKCGATALNPYCSVNPKMKEWAETMTLLAFRGMVMRPQNNPVNLAADNIVFNNSDWKESLNGDNYWSSLSGNVLTTYFGVNTSSNCQIQLTLPENAAFGFDDIVSFGEITPSTTNCSGNNGFTITVRYFSCGQLTTAALTGTSNCMQVNECVCSNAGLTLCDALPELTDICYQPRLDQLYQNALETYAENMDALYDAYLAAYNSACDDAFSTEALSYSGPKNAYHYTLFYYDQAGNLVKTIAPEGTHSAYDPANADAARNSVTNFTTYTNPSGFTPSPFPTHTFQTTYAYNSYNQLVSTSNPDQDGATKYWYDRYGRIVASQNPVQLDDKKYSYVLYDAQGRPVEIGQADLDFAQGVQRLPIAESDLKKNDKGTAFKNWVYSCARTEVVYTVYDAPMSAAVSAKFAAGIQQNLRLRVASVVYFDTVSASVMPTTGYASANHYSYDLHGNVIETLQDVPVMAPVEQDIKSTQYSFELLSGNVKKVDYQKGKRDRMTHEYNYDKLNRLTEVYTSTDDGIHKSREAHYRYFDYGPLSRVEIGQHKVQANDYSYTINGWLKGMNSNVLSPSNDPGRDGGTGYYAANIRAHETVAADMTGYTLGYFQQDYKPIGNTTFEADPYALNNGNPNAMAAAIRQLFNGNISHTVTSISGFETQAGVYAYDQLQRLKSMRVFRNANLAAANNWVSAAETQEYASSYTYSKNGNLKTLNRNGTAALGLNMDQFTYNYTAGANRLTHVTDGSTLTGAYNNDINSGQTGVAGQLITASQTSNNYQYDKLGQLVKDVQEGNQQYTWRMGDKKLALQKSSTKQLEFVYNPFGQRVLKIEKAVSDGVVVAQNVTPWIYTYYAYDANGQVMATYKVYNYTNASSVLIKTAELDEQLIYGAGRLGAVQSAAGNYVYTNQQTLSAEGPVWISQLGEKNYELTNHLGNVNAVITDRKTISDGTQLYVNYLFDAGAETWLAGSNASISATNGQLNVTTTVGSNNFVYKTVPVEAGKTYTIKITASKGTAPNLELFLFGVTPSTYTLNNGTMTSITFTPTTTNANLGLIIRPTATTAAYSYSVQDVFIQSHTHYTAVAVMKADYYPFGMQMPGRVINSGSYRFGFNGMEVDPEMKGQGNSYTTEFRQYDPRLGRWLSLDPLMMKFPGLSPYCGFDNNPIYFIDPYGLSSQGGPGGKPTPVDRTGNDPRSDSEKEYRRLEVQKLIREGGTGRDNRVVFIYKNIDNSGNVGDITYTYTYSVSDNKATENWSMTNQKLGYSHGISQTFKMFVPEPTKPVETDTETLYISSKDPKNQAGNNGPVTTSEDIDKSKTEIKTQKKAPPTIKKNPEPEKKNPEPKKEPEPAPPPCEDNITTPFIGGDDYFTPTNRTEVVRQLRPIVDYMAKNPTAKFTIDIYTEFSKTGSVPHLTQYWHKTGSALAWGRYVTVRKIMHNMNPQININNLYYKAHFNAADYKFSVTNPICD